MKAMVYHKGHDVRLEDAPIPTLKEGEALIKVAYTGICGSDVSIFNGKHPRAVPPVIIGHEFSGELVEIKGDAKGLKVGDRVVADPLLDCRVCQACLDGIYNSCLNLKMLGHNADGSFAEYVKTRISHIYKMPDGLPMDMAALAEPTAVSAHALRVSRAHVGDNVVVLGGGPIGILVAQMARITTNRPVSIVEIGEWRLEFARKLGFDPIDAKTQNVRDAIMERTNGRGADVLFDAAGAAPLTEQMCHFCKVGGQIVIVAMPKEPRPFDFGIVTLKELDLHGCRAFNYADMETGLQMMAARRIDIESMITQRLPLEQCVEGIELAQKADASMKILLKP